MLYLLLVLCFFPVFIATSDSYSVKKSKWRTQHRYRSSLALESSSTASDRLEFTDAQVLEFADPATKVKVLLIGSMHYNPASIALTKDIIEKLGENEKLGSVIVESCPIRWNKTMEMRKEDDSKFMRLLLNNEMITASDVGASYGAPIVLGDQLINITNSRIVEAMKETVKDLVTPFGGGWQSLYNDINEAKAIALPEGSSYLGIKDFLDPKLLFSAPVSLIRYPLAFALKAPKFGIPAIALLIYTSLSVNDVPLEESLTLLERFQDFCLELFTFTFEIALFSRVFLITILADRNEVLAESIRNECIRVSSATQKDASVVAVLGMAHCNGIKKIISEQIGLP